MHDTCKKAGVVVASALYSGESDFGSVGTAWVDDEARFSIGLDPVTGGCVFVR